MSGRALALLASADAQISELSRILSTGGDQLLERQCPNRQKLGDGTVAASAQHIINAYGWIAAFLRGSESGHGAPPHHGSREAVELDELLQGLSSARAELNVIADLTDAQLDAVPPAGASRFCDGRRTVEQATWRMLGHQGQQLKALAAVAA